MDELESISPVDGRYIKYTSRLIPFFSELSLIKYRIFVEIEYLISLSESDFAIRSFSDEEITILKSLSNISIDEARIVKEIELKGYKDIKATNHDVKAVEYYIKEKLKETSLKDVLEWVHFGVTSEDINNLSYALMISDSLEKIILPTLEKIFNLLEFLAEKYSALPMLARTHGQPASPTTFGKEFKIFSSRLFRQLEQLSNRYIFVKFSGATGNYNAHYVAYPNTDWIKFTENFVEKLNKNRKIKLKPNFLATQIESNDSLVELFSNLSRINNILINLSQDIWRYISDDWIQQKVVEGEVGSSTMPHKVNPIDFENAEGNLGIANSLFNYFSNKLPISRLQRDLSDSTVKRNFGVAFSHSVIAYNYLIKGLEKISVNEAKVIMDLEDHPEVISEAIQTILRREGIELPYEKLKDLTRGKKVKIDDFKKFIDELNISSSLKEELKKITPLTYTGIANYLANIRLKE